MRLRSWVLIDIIDKTTSTKRLPTHIRNNEDDWQVPSIEESVPIVTCLQVNNWDGRLIRYYEEERTEHSILLDYWLENNETYGAVHHQHHIYFSTVTLYILRENNETSTEENIEYEQAVQDGRENYYRRNILGSPFQSTRVLFNNRSVSGVPFEDPNVARGRTRGLIGIPDSDGSTDSDSETDTEKKPTQYKTRGLFDISSDSDSDESDVKPPAIKEDTGKESETTDSTSTTTINGDSPVDRVKVRNLKYPDVRAIERTTPTEESVVVPGWVDSTRSNHHIFYPTRDVVDFTTGKEYRTILKKRKQPTEIPRVLRYRQLIQLDQSFTLGTDPNVLRILTFLRHFWVPGYFFGEFQETRPVDRNYIPIPTQVYQPRRPRRFVRRLPGYPPRPLVRVLPLLNQNHIIPERPVNPLAQPILTLAEVQERVPGFAVNAADDNPTEEVVPEENKLKRKLRSSTKKNKKK